MIPTRIRPAVLEDLADIKDIAVRAQMFTADNHLVASATYAPKPFADRLWNLSFIAVDPAYQGQGIGGDLVAEVERTLRVAA